MSLHPLSMVRLHAKHKARKVNMSYMTWNLVSLAVQSVSKARYELFKKSGSPSMPEALAPYMMFVEAKSRLFCSLTA